MAEYGGIYTQGNATGTAAAVNTGLDNAAWTKLTGFSSLFPANALDVNAGIDELQVQGEGVYEVDFAATFWGEASQTYRFGLLRNGTITPDIRADASIPSTQVFTPVAFNGLVEVDAGDRFAVAAQIDDAGPGTITLRHGQFVMTRKS